MKVNNTILFNNKCEGRERERNRKVRRERENQAADSLKPWIQQHPVLFVLLHPEFLGGGGPEVIQNFSLFTHLSK